MSETIRYALSPDDPHGHFFVIRLVIDRPDPQGQRLALPAWTPGSYMIREFARHIVDIRACVGEKNVRLTKLDKQTWQADICLGPLEIIYKVYAFDASVRGAYLDTQQGFFNGACVFLCVVGQAHQPCLLDITIPPEAWAAEWRVATALPARDAPALGCGQYCAQDYDDLIDHPVQLGRFDWVSFSVAGVVHAIAISGRHDTDLDRFAADIQSICQCHIDFFGTAVPFVQYVFLLQVVGSGYGGLEHRNSTALICSRDNLPYANMDGVSEAYTRLLGLISHEYFHAWWVKRVKPAAFMPYRLEAEVYTRQLWVFEGMTSYYDNLALLRSHLLGLSDWLSLVSKTCTHVWSEQGRRHQSVVESSFDAWVKFYRPDAHSPNVTVSYYAKGELIALALDLVVRDASNEACSLDHILRAIWQRYGIDGVGLEEGEFEKIAEKVSGVQLRDFFKRFVYGCQDPPLKALLAKRGLRLDFMPQSESPWLGIKMLDDHQGIRLSTVYSGGPAERAGLAPNDVVIAVDSLRVTPKSLPELLSRRGVNTPLVVYAFRGDELMQFDVISAESPRTKAVIQVDAKPTTRMQKLRHDWLGC